MLSFPGSSPDPCLDMVFCVFVLACCCLLVLCGLSLVLGFCALLCLSVYESVLFRLCGIFDFFSWWFGFRF